MSSSGKPIKFVYEALINRKVSITCCVFGLLQVLVGLFMIICAFIFLGGFCENLSCEGFTAGTGFYVGFPILIPGILGLVVVGTRHISALYAFMLTNALVFVFSVVHAILSHRDYTDFWEMQKNLYDNGKCNIISSSKCTCVGSAVTYPYRCDLIKLGYENNWIIFGLSIAAIALCLFGFCTALIGRALKSAQGSKRY